MRSEQFISVAAKKSIESALLFLIEKSFRKRELRKSLADRGLFLCADSGYLEKENVLELRFPERLISLDTSSVKLFWIVSDMPDPLEFRNVLVFASKKPHGLKNLILVIRDLTDHSTLIKILAVSSQLGIPVLLDSDSYWIQDFAFDYWLSHARNKVFPVCSVFEKCVRVLFNSFKLKESSTDGFLKSLSAVIESRKPSVYSALAFKFVNSEDFKSRMSIFFEEVKDRIVKEIVPSFSWDFQTEIRFIGDDEYKTYQSLDDFCRDVENGILPVNVIFSFKDKVLEKINNPLVLNSLFFLNEVIISVPVSETDRLFKLFSFLEEEDKNGIIPLSVFLTFDSEKLESSKINGFLVSFNQKRIPVYLFLGESHLSCIPDLLKFWLYGDFQIEVQPFSFILKSFVYESFGIEEKCRLFESLYGNFLKNLNFESSIKDLCQKAIEECLF